MKKRLFIIIPIIVVMTIIIVLLLTSNNNKEQKSDKNLQTREYVVKIKKDSKEDYVVNSIFPNNCISVVSIENQECIKENKKCNIEYFKITGIKQGTTYVRFVKDVNPDLSTPDNTITYRVEVDKNLNIKVETSEYVEPQDDFDFSYGIYEE